MSKELNNFESQSNSLSKSGMDLGKTINDVTSKFNNWLVVIEKTAKAIKYLIDTSSKFQSAKLGLESVTVSKGYDPVLVQKMIKDLNSVRGGLMSVGEASIAMKNLLTSNFTLDESVKMLNRIGDAAAFGKIESLSFAEAVISATEGIKIGNPEFLKNAGIISNIANNQQLLGNITNDSSARLVFFNSIMEQTSGQIGNTNKLIESSEGALGRFNNATEKVSITLGSTLGNALNASLDIVTDVINLFNDAPADVKKFIFPLAGLSFIFGETTDEAAKFKEEIYDLDSQINSSNDGLEKLQYLYDTLSLNTTLSKEEQEHYNSTLQDAIELYPQIVTGYDSLTGQYTTNASVLKDLISQEKELLQLKNEQRAYELANAIKQSTLQYEEQKAELDEVNRSLEEHRGIVANLRNDQEQYQNILKDAPGHVQDWNEEQKNARKLLTDVEIKLIQNQDEIRGLSEKYIELVPGVNNARLNVNEFIAAALKTGNFPQIFDALSLSIQGSSNMVQLLESTFMNMSSRSIAAIFA